MNMTIEAIDARVVSSIAPISADAPRLLHLEAAAQPKILVLQPDGALHPLNSREFQEALDSALAQATESVIVDLVRVGSIDADSIAVLVAGIQRAAALGKDLSFQSMRASDRLALETAWAQQQWLNAGNWEHTFNSDLEAFLDSFTPDIGRNPVSLNVGHSNNQPKTVPTVSCSPAAKSGTGKICSGSSKTAT